MSECYTMARIYTGFMGPSLLLGVLWFSDTLSNTIIIAGVLAGFSSVAAASISQHKLPIHSARWFLIVLCIIGISAGFVLLVDDLGKPSGAERIEWDVVAIKALDIAALSVLAGTALGKR